MGKGGVTLAPLAVLAIAVDGDDSRRLDRVRAGLASGAPPAVAPYWAGDQVIAAWSLCGAAGEIALGLAADGYRVGADYVAAAAFKEPFSVSERLPVAATAAASAASASTLSGSACVTGDFAAALTAGGPEAPGTELVGEIDAIGTGAPLSLYALRPAS